MIQPLLIAGVFAGMGVVLVRSARRSLASGRAVTDEDDLLSRRAQPLRFTLFVATQLIFGAFFVLAGLALAAAAIYSRFH